MKSEFNNIFDSVDYNFLKIIASFAQMHNTRLFIVGGAVRDYFLNISISDIDLILDKSAINFVKKIKHDDIKIHSIHKEFDTVKISYKNKIYDLATTRIEKYPFSGVLPVVIKKEVDIKEDYLRRDFSINSMYFEVVFKDNKLDFSIIDYANGVNDIKSKTLKVLHSKSYIDDPTRILRGINFKHRFGFDFSNYDKNLISNCLKSLSLENASISRIESVFFHVLNTKKADDVFSDIVNNKVHKLLNLEDNNIDLEKIKSIVEKMGLNSDSKAYFLINVIKNMPVNKADFKNNFEIYSYFKKMPIYDIAYYYYKTNDISAILYFKFKDVKLKVNGNDLLNLNFCKGKIFSKILNSLLAFELDLIEKNNSLLSKEEEVEWIKKNFIFN